MYPALVEFPFIYQKRAGNEISAILTQQSFTKSVLEVQPVILLLLLRVLIRDVPLVLWE